MAFRLLSTRVADLFGLQHPRSVYYRRPEVVGSSPALNMTGGTRIGLVVLLVLFIVIVGMAALIAAAITGYSLFEMVSG